MEQMNLEKGSYDGTQVVTTSGSTIELCDVRTGKVLWIAALLF